jgi:hypothetical protein
VHALTRSPKPRISATSTLPDCRLVPLFVVSFPRSSSCSLVLFLVLFPHLVHVLFPRLVRRLVPLSHSVVSCVVSCRIGPSCLVPHPISSLSRLLVHVLAHRLVPSSLHLPLILFHVVPSALTNTHLSSPQILSHSRSIMRCAVLPVVSSVPLSRPIQSRPLSHRPMSSHAVPSAYLPLPLSLVLLLVSFPVFPKSLVIVPCCPLVSSISSGRIPTHVRVPSSGLCPHCHLITYLVIHSSVFYHMMISMNDQVC